ncbi:MAG: hypothetical protein IKU19_00780, partial [Clostridia bacterium]|nr:hypothetical protein [Clostridia bacterium]
MKRLKNKTLRAFVFAVIVILACLMISGCADGRTPYEINNSEGYTVSVKYDANGGIFTTNTSVIVDSFDPKTATEIALLSPDDAARGNDAFTAINNGHFLAGWYTERIEEADGSYSYSGKWDFETDRVEVDASAEYTADEPVMTLYAAWIPMFSIEFYNTDDSSLNGTYTFDPNTVSEITVPTLNEETGAVDMFQFPERPGFTFEKVYYDENATVAIDSTAILHPGVVDYEKGTATDTTLKLYVEWTEGEWYHIYNVDQFLDNASVKGNYEIHADLDFTDKNWPTSFMYGKFSGVINGNGYTLKNIDLEQTNNSKENAGLFGCLTETAQINDVKFENVTFTMKAGTRKVGSCFGLFAGRILADAKINNV